MYVTSQNTYDVAGHGDEKWGSGSPFFQKTIVISLRLTYERRQIYGGFQGAQPLGGVWGGAPAGFGAESQKNCAYTRNHHLLSEYHVLRPITVEEACGIHFLFAFELKLMNGQDACLTSDHEGFGLGIES